MWLATAAAFSLICSGTVGREGDRGHGSQPFSKSLRIDLNAGKYCEGSCRAVRNLQGSSPSVITLRNEDSGSHAAHEVFNRDTNVLTGISTSGKSSRKWEGTCHVGPFTGFN